MITLKKGKSEKRPSPNASVAAQKAWALLTPAQKAVLKKRYRQDPDRDGVPTGYDCRPYDPKKQEAFLPEDQAYIKTHPIVPIKRKGSRERLLGEGTNGYVLGVAGNSRVALKVGKSEAWNDLKSEARFYKKHQMSKLPLMIPLKEVKTDKGEYAVLKPIVKPIAEPGYVKNKSAFTDQRLEELRQKIIKLSYRGYIFSDGLQLGIDKAGRLLQFDTGAMKRVHSKSGISNKPFEENNIEWKTLLKKLGKSTSKYGKIERTTLLDHYYTPKKQLTTSVTQKTTAKKSRA